MGAEGSKAGGKKAAAAYSWVTPEEQNIIKIKVHQLATPQISPASVQAAASSTCGDELGARFTKLLCRWRAKTNKSGLPPSSSEEPFTSAQMSSLFFQALNPDPSVQAELTIALAGSYDGSVTATDLLQYVGLATSVYCSLPRVSVATTVKAERFSGDDGGGARVAYAWLHDLLFDGASCKQTAGKAVPSKSFNLEMLEKWLRGHSALFSVVQFTVVRSMVSAELPMAPPLMPVLHLPKNVSPRVSCSEVLLLNTALPPLLRREWRLLFSNTVHGDSFSLLMKQIVNAGPTIVVVEDEDGNKFGGFASGAWEVRPQFHGTGESFLLSLRPESGVYRSTGYNSNYQYLNYLHNNTMPNGLGMGGREELFGMFLSDDFGECQVAPSCTTFHSPQICPNRSPKIRYLTIWGVGEEAKDSSDEEEDGAAKSKKRSALDTNADATAMLDMIGRVRASDGLREPDPESD